jgi:hypothetical protein
MNIETTILDKTIFKGCFLWSRQNGDVIEIDKIISVHIDISLNQKDTDTLIDMFGKERYLKVLNSLKEHLSENHFKEAIAQFNYSLNKGTYICERSVEDILKQPTQRDIDFILKSHSKETILLLIEKMNLTFNQKTNINQMTQLK